MQLAVCYVPTEGGAVVMCEAPSTIIYGACGRSELALVADLTALPIWVSGYTVSASVQLIMVYQHSSI